MTEIEYKRLAQAPLTVYLENEEVSMSTEILELCKDIKRTVDDQPTRGEIQNMAKLAAYEALTRHEAGCAVRADYPDIKRSIGVLEGKQRTLAPAKKDRSNRALIAAGTIIGTLIATAAALWPLFNS
jgi:hypothetical protein